MPLENEHFLNFFSMCAENVGIHELVPVLLVTWECSEQNALILECLATVYDSHCEQTPCTSATLSTVLA